MPVTIEQLEELMRSKEDEQLEFKEARTGFHFDRLVEYCVALANERGGRLVLGVSDGRPRQVVGTQAVSDPGGMKRKLYDTLHIRIEVDEVRHPKGRVVVFQVPSRPIGVPLACQGAYLMRSGSSLVAMTPDQLRRIFDESIPDFSAEICSGANMSDLDQVGIERFRDQWMRKSKNASLAAVSQEQILADAELMRGKRITFAALILLGTREALGRYLAQAELVFEYRSNDANIRYQQRVDFREGFFLFRDDIWELVNLRNDKQQFQDGLFVWDIPTFNETVVREAILNAICHRDYRMSGSVFVRQYPSKLEIISPGGLPAGITPQNIMYRQEPRNRRLAEAVSRCGLVERAGQGIDLMFRECIRESKARPDFRGTDAYQVSLTFRGEVRDIRFLRFIEKIGRERLDLFSVEDFLLLELANRGARVPADLKPNAARLIESGVLESVGGGKCMLSRRFYEFIGEKGVYTRKRGLDRATNKALLLKHVRDNTNMGSKLDELMQVLPGHSRQQVQYLLRELRKAGEVHLVGKTNSARWHEGST